MAHTKGPWLIANNGKKGKQSATFRIWRTDPDQPQGEEFRNRGFEVIAPHVAGKANARLIAAAPDLLEALKHARSQIQHPDQMIDEAISKATGAS